MRHILIAILLVITLFPFLASYSQTDPDTLIRLKEFEVTDFMGEKIFQPADTIGKLAISQMASRDVGDMLRGQSNISGIRKGGTAIDPVVRGFKYSQLNVQLNEGHKIEGACPNRMDPPTSHVDIDDIAVIEVFKGPYALRFGPNFGGMIHMHTWSLKKYDTFQADVEAVTGYESAWNGFKEHLVVNGGNKYFQLKLSGNYKKYGDYENGNNETVQSSFERYSYGGILSITPSDHHAFHASYDRSIGKNLDFPSLPMDERLDETNLYALDYVYKNTSKTFQGIHAKFYYSDVHHEMDNKQRPVSDTVTAISIIDAVNMGYRGEITVAVGKGMLHAGTDMEDISKDGDRTKYMITQPTMPVKLEKLWDNAHISNYGFFAEYSRYIGDFTLVGAIRLDLNQATSNPLSLENMQGQQIYLQEDVESSYTNFSISLGADYFFTKNLMMRLSAGRGMRSPDMTERFIILLPIGYDNYDYLGNPVLKPETNYQADLMLKWTTNRTGDLKMNIFYSNVDNYITGELLPESIVKPQTRGVYGVKQFVNIDRAWLTGFEFEYNTPTTKPWLLELNAGYTYGINPLSKHYIIENGEVTGTEEVKNDPLSEIPPLEGSVRFSWKFFNNRFIPKVNLRAVAAQKNISVAYDERSTPGFVLAGISLYYKFSPALQVNAGIDNIFDKSYYEHLNRNMVGTLDNFYEPGINCFVTLKFTP